ncbi:hypothetical protein IL306_010780 [Fusarium sp. DS 682]|nr:hypothetical protein IL306_010780 [Fusarium sp. DS 682]
MADPLSLAASIAGLISITVEAVKFLSPYVSAAKETPQVAAHVYSEVQSTQVILMGLQSLTKNLASVKVQHAALIGVNQVVTILTDGVLLYSELHTELQSLPAKDGDVKIPLIGRLQWALKESTFITLLNRLQSFKNSMTLVLMILQSDSGQTAKQHQEQLYSNVKLLLESNDDLSRRLMSIEDALDAQTIISRRMSFLSLPGSPSQDTIQQSESGTNQTSATLIGTDSGIGISKFDFEDDLESSRVYRRAQRETMDFSFRSSVARSRNWSVFSGLSLSDVSAISVIALPVYQNDLTNAQHYDFGEDAPVISEPSFPTDEQPLLMECLEINLKMLQIPEMKRYFDEVSDPPNAFFQLRAVLRQIMPLVILVRALDPNVDINIDNVQDSLRYYKFKVITSEVQRQDRSIARAAIYTSIDRLQDGVQSKESAAAIKDLERKVQDWKGIQPNILGELILSKPLYVSKGSETRQYYGYLFRKMLLLCKDTRDKKQEIRQQGIRSFFKSNSASETQQAKFLLKGRVFLKDIVAVIPASRLDSYVCLIQWIGASDNAKSEFSIIFAVESQMRLWASKIDEYRMIAKLMEKPIQTDLEGSFEDEIDPPSLVLEDD